MRTRRPGKAPGAVLPWLAVGLVVVVVCWLGLSSGVLERVSSPAPRAAAQASPGNTSPTTRTGSGTGSVTATSAPSRRTDVPTPGFEESPTPLGRPPAVARGKGSYRFMQYQDDGRPVAYDPCRPVHFTIRAKGAPAGGHAVILQAISRISVATGLTFVEDSATREAPSSKRAAYQPKRYGDRWAPVLIAWQTPAENPDFATDVAGEAGSAPVDVPGRDSVYVTGQVQLDQTKIGGWLRQGGQVAARTLIMHELGHLVGLDHVKDPKQIMFPQVSPDMPSFGRGDRKGLAALGRGTCAPYL